MKRLIYILPVLFFIASCEKVITVKVPEYTPKLVVNCTGEVDEPINVSVSKSIGVLDYNGSQPLSIYDATVKLYVNGTYTETLEWRSPLQNPPVGHISKTIVKPGDEYKIVVSAPGFQDAEASAAVTELVPVRVERTRNARTGKWGNPQDEIRLVIDDPSARNHYMLQFFESYLFDSTYYQFPHYGGGCISSSDPSIESLDDGFAFNEDDCLYPDEIFINDELFNGRTKEIKFYVDSSWGFSHMDSFGKTYYGQIKMYHLSESHYKYLKTYRYASNNSGNPFAEPINVHTNIVNGYGIFSLSNVDWKILP